MKLNSAAFSSLLTREHTTEVIYNSSDCRDDKDTAGRDSTGLKQSRSEGMVRHPQWGFSH